MSIIDAFPPGWVVDVQVTGPVHRDADGYLASASDPVTVEGCLLAPGSSSASDLNTPATVEAPEETATLYCPPGTQIRQRDTVTVPTSHLLAGRWLVETPPAPWPLGLAVTMTRR